MLSEYLGFEHSGEQIQQFADNLFGGTSTFHEGKIGAWKTQFDEDHLQAFNQIYGETLVAMGYEMDAELPVGTDSDSLYDPIKTLMPQEIAVTKY